MLDAYYECHRSIEMARLGYLFANGGLSSQDAYDMMYDLQKIAGDYTLESFTVEDAMDRAADRWENLEEELRPLVASACQRVWSKWSSDGEMSSAAIDYAMDLAQEWAIQDGIKLIEYGSEEAAE